MIDARLGGMVGGEGHKGELRKRNNDSFSGSMYLQNLQKICQEFRTLSAESDCQAIP